MMCIIFTNTLALSFKYPINVLFQENNFFLPHRPRPRNANIQYEARTLPQAELKNEQSCKEVASFLDNVIDRYLLT